MTRDFLLMGVCELGKDYWTVESECFELSVVGSLFACRILSRQPLTMMARHLCKLGRPSHTAMHLLMCRRHYQFCRSTNPGTGWAASITNAVATVLAVVWWPARFYANTLQDVSSSSLVCFPSTMECLISLKACTRALAKVSRDRFAP